MTCPRRLSMRARPTLLGMLAGALARVRGHGVAVQPPLPNVVLILADDMHPSDLAVMPTTRTQIGDAGTIFSNLFASAPPSSPLG